MEQRHSDGVLSDYIPYVNLIPVESPRTLRYPPRLETPRTLRYRSRLESPRTLRYPPRLESPRTLRYPPRRAFVRCFAFRLNYLIGKLKWEVDFIWALKRM